MLVETEVGISRERLERRGKRGLGLCSSSKVMELSLNQKLKRKGTWEISWLENLYFRVERLLLRGRDSFVAWIMFLSFHCCLFRVGCNFNSSFY